MATLITGATGAIGPRLIANVEGPRVLARTPERVRGATALRWSSDAPLPEGALDDVDVVVHLAGEPVAQRWTEASKTRMTASRVEGTRRIVDGITRAAKKPRVLVCASAVGIYGDRGDEVLTEESGAGTGFLAELCVAWEREALLAERHGIRVVNARIGVVLMKGEGALGKMLTPFKLGIAGKLGSGKQWMPWIHVDDVVGLLLFAAADASIRGPINLAAPAPATNEQFTRALGSVLHRPTFIPTPAFALKVAFGDMASIVLASQRVIPQVAVEKGYVFQHPELHAALADLT